MAIYTKRELNVLNRAAKIMEEKLPEYGDILTSVDITKQFLKASIGHKQYESFTVIYLDNRHRVIKVGELFRGTINGASVYPREVAKAALEHNAAAIIVAHNHPSGDTTPSAADIRLTDRLVDALELIDIRVLDHFIVGPINEPIVSFAERGLIKSP